MQVNKVNMDWVQGETKRLEEEKKKRKTGGNLPPLNWYNLKLGDTILRLLPPWDSLGIPFFKQSKHWAIPPDRGIYPCLCGTWPEKTNTCYFCDQLEKVQAKFPEIKLWRHLASSQYLTNAIVRDDPEEGAAAESKGPQIVRLPEGAYNWLILQITNPKIGSMVFDIEKGCDFKITMTKTRAGKKERTKYSFTFMPGQGSLHDDPKVVEDWCSKIVNIPKVIKYPNDEELINHSEAAIKAGAWWVRKFKKSADDNASESGQVVGKAEPRDEDDSDDEPDDAVAAAGAEEKAAAAARAKAADKKPDMAKPKAALGTKPDATPTNVEKANGKVKPLQDQSPAATAKPLCFAGLEAPEPHEDDGTYGFREDLDKCMICPHELQCMDAKGEKGL